MNEEQEQHTFWGALKTMFGRGLVVMIPVVITYGALRFLFETVDGIMGPVYHRILGREIMGLGFLTMVVLILIVGALSGNLIARTIFRLFEKALTSIPLARSIYNAMKDLMSSFQVGGKGNSFRKVVLVEYPRQGLYTIGFMTNEFTLEDKSGHNEMVSVFIPNPPNPTSGLMILAPAQSVQTLNMSVEDGFKLVFSAGMVTQGTLTVK